MNKDMPAWKELLAGVTMVDVTALMARLGCWAEQILEGLMTSRKGGTTKVVPVENHGICSFKLLFHNHDSRPIT